MDLPNIERGMRILADDINRISREVRASALTSVIGGQFTRSASGTSISIDGKFFGGGSTGVCPFEITVKNQAGDGIPARIIIAQGQIDNRWPEGMGLGFPEYLLPIEETCYIYCKMVFQNGDVILEPAANAITFMVSADLQPSTENDQFVLVGTVIVEDGKITQIYNVCSSITPNACLLNWGNSV
jgi:hypothetical protein